MLRRLPYRPRPRSRAERERRAGRFRRGAAIAVVGALALGWFATARIGRTDALEPTMPAAASPPPTTNPAARGSLPALLPRGSQCHDQDRSDAETRCEVDGIEVDYQGFGVAEIAAAYRAAVGAGPSTSHPAAGSPACARGAEDERAWSRPATPLRTAGRYACRVEAGRAAMWWTVADRGLLAHATATDGDLGSLFSWWESNSER